MVKTTVYSLLLLTLAFIWCTNVKMLTQANIEQIAPAYYMQQGCAGAIIHCTDASKW
jgi:hypothetical protein